MGRQSVFVGDQFSYLTVSKDLGVVGKNRKFSCICVCGGTCEVFGNNLKKGNTKSCGCKLSKYQSERWEKKYVDRGFGVKSQQTPEYLAWRNMISRCNNSADISYDNYGAKGITICEGWLIPEKGFENFINDVGFKPSKSYSLDRVNVLEGYSKDNVRWATPSVQSRNKNKIINTTSKYKGVSLENGRWRARIKDEHGMATQLGMFDDEVSAAMVVDYFLLQIFGDDCSWTNLKLGLLQEGYF